MEKENIVPDKIVILRVPFLVFPEKNKDLWCLSRLACETEMPQTAAPVLFLYILGRMPPVAWVLCAAYLGYFLCLFLAAQIKSEPRRLFLHQRLGSRPLSFYLFIHMRQDNKEKILLAHECVLGDRKISAAAGTLIFPMKISKEPSS